MTHPAPPSDQHQQRSTVTLGSVLAMAGAEQRAGNLEIAARLYRQILSKIPEQSQALTMLGSIAYQQGDDGAGDDLIEQAIAALARALESVPHTAPEHAGLANLLLARNRPKEALRHLAEVKLPLHPVRSAATEFNARRERAEAAGLPPILMTAMPKSASESLWNMLGETLGLAQSHVTIGLFPQCCLVPYRLHDLSAGGVIAKEHFGPDEHNVAMLADAGIDRVLVHLRDPRQALLSWAHFVRDDVGRRMLAPIWRKIVPPAHVLNRDLHQVIDWCLEHYFPLLVDFAEGWYRWERSSHAGLRVRCLTFERFITDREQYLTDVMNFYGLEPDHPIPNKETSIVHWRRGQIDEWRTVFTAAQCRRAGHALPGSLIARFGWTQ